MEQIGTLFGNVQRRIVRKRTSERGDLLEYFTHNVNLDRDGKRFKKLKISAVAVRLQGLKLADLYFLKSTCEDAQRRGGSWSKTFWGSLKPRV